MWLADFITRHEADIELLALLCALRDADHPAIGRDVEIDILQHEYEFNALVDQVFFRAVEDYCGRIHTQRGV